MRHILILIILSMIFTSLPSDAKGQNNLSGYKKNAKALMVKSPQHAARIVQNRFGGKVLKVSKKKNNNRIGYKVKLIKKDGHIISVLVDAHSGRIQG